MFFVPPIKKTLDAEFFVVDFLGTFCMGMHPIVAFLAVAGVAAATAPALTATDGNVQLQLGGARSFSVVCPGPATVPCAGPDVQVGLPPGSRAPTFGPNTDAGIVRRGGAPCKAAEC